MMKNEALAASTAHHGTYGLRKTLSGAAGAYHAARDHYKEVEADYNKAHRAIYEAALAKLEKQDDAE
jgi:hypothetical protein